MRGKKCKLLRKLARATKEQLQFHPALEVKHVVSYNPVTGRPTPVPLTATYSKGHPRAVYQALKRRTRGVDLAYLSAAM